MKLRWIFALCFFTLLPREGKSEERPTDKTPESFSVSPWTMPENFKKNIGIISAGILPYKVDHKNDIQDQRFETLQETNELNLKGVEVSLGREFNRHGLFSATTKLYSRALGGEIAQDRRTFLEEGQGYQDWSIQERTRFYGGGLAQTLNFNYEAQAFLFQPFIEVAYGLGRVSSRLNYSHQVNEGPLSFYRVKGHEIVNIRELYLGINLIGSRDLFSFLKVGLLQEEVLKKEVNAQKALSTWTNRAPDQYAKKTEPRAKKEENLGVYIGAGLYF